MADNEVQIVITASDKASNIIAGISKSLKSVVGAVSDITSEYIEYGDQVRKLSTFTGMQADETSRLIQLADDAFVSFDTLRMSAKYMADNGIAPNIENLARLSDEFLKIDDPLLQSQFLIDNFSRAGMEMGEIMKLSGDQIREMGASIDDALILDQEKLDGIVAGKQALDQFNDSMAAMRYDIAGKMLEIFQKMPKPIQDVVLGLGLMTKSGLLDQLTNLFLILSNIGGLKASLTGIGLALKGVAVGLWATLAPVLAVAAAIAALGLMMYKAWHFGLMLGDMINKLAALDAFHNPNFMSLLGNAIKFEITGGNARAGGGPVSANTPYIVGERGPELFVPSASGGIVPNNALGGMTLVYSPMISLADRSEVEAKFAPIVRQIMRGG